MEGKRKPGFVSSILLEKIDRLFACNLGEYVDLPQLVVVGDQSSGKSSVLEALTGLPFPRDSGLCTRFATQITFRRSTESKIEASIIPATTCSNEHKTKVLEWKKTNMECLDGPSFAAIMQEVMDVMGVGPTENQKQKTFSEDVLRLEIFSPDEEHFSVIDVPGIFKRTTQGVTTKEDMAMVDQMVNGFMANRRSVMLVVVPCNVDIATQEILERAEGLDAEGIRTFGVLTKPDLVDKGAEQAVIELIEGRKHQLKLGWHLLRNPGQADQTSSTEKRNHLEMQFFNKEKPWSSIDKGKVGVETLRIRLQDILTAHIRREFPKVKSEVSRKLLSAQQEVKSLGPKRQNENEQRQYLMELALKFQEIVTLAVHSDYGRTNIFKDEKLRLATAAINRGETFSKTMAEKGHAVKFDSEDGSKTNESSLDSASDEITLEEKLTELHIENGKCFQIRLEENIPEVEDIVCENMNVALPQDKNMFAWLKKVHHQSRGFELGTFDPSLLVMTMKQQATKWEPVALGYASDVVTLVHSFILKILKIIVTNERVRSSIQSLLMDDLRGRYQKAMAHTRFLLHVELEGTPATHNHYFNDTLEKCRQERLRSHVEKKSFQVNFTNGPSTVVRLEDIVQNHPMSNTNHVVQEMHDILKAYYKLARKRFVDSVRMQVADHFLVTGNETPLKLFSPTFVSKLTADQLEEVAGEDLILKSRRFELDRQIEQLEKAKKILSA